MIEIGEGHAMRDGCTLSTERRHVSSTAAGISIVVDGQRCSCGWAKATSPDDSLVLRGENMNSENKDDFDTEAMARAIYERTGLVPDVGDDWDSLLPETKARRISDAGQLIARYLTRRDEKKLK